MESRVWGLDDIIKEVNSLKQALEVVDLAWKRLWVYNDFQEFKKMYWDNNSRTIISAIATYVVWNLISDNPVDLVMLWLAW